MLETRRHEVCAPSVADLPPPPSGRSGWPWTGAGVQFQEEITGNKWPPISIITPSYNQGQFIEETIRSVLLQGYPNLEYIVVDGGSTDRTVDVIRQYEPWITYWVSEPDQGQAHAINKGLAVATGEVFNWINSDDVLLPNALFTIAGAFAGYDAVAGPVINFSETGEEELVMQRGLTPSRMIRGQRGVTYHQPGLWLRREKILKCGGIDDRYHYAFDWDMTIRYLSLFPRITYLTLPLARFRLHEDSKTTRVWPKFQEERRSILEKLLTLDQFESLHPVAGRRLRHVAWSNRLSDALSDTSAPPWKQFLRLLREACAAPTVRWTRRTIGVLRILAARALRQNGRLS